MNILQQMMTALLVMTLLTGCNSHASVEVKEEGGQPEQVQLTVWGGSPQQEVLVQMIEGFKEAYKDEATFDITIEVEEEGTSKDTILANVNEAADVFSFADDQLMELAASGVIEVIEAADEIKAVNVGGAVEAASINESLYAYPMTADNGYFMFYNKKYLSEEDVTTLDQMLEVAGSLNKKVAMDWTSGWYLYSFFGNTGLNLGLNPDGITNHCDWNSSSGDIKGIDIGEAMLAIARNPGFLNTGDEGFIAGVKEDEIIAGINGIWNAKVLQEIWGEDFAATKLPTYTCAGQQVQLASYAGYKMIGVNAYSAQKEWATKLAEWLTNEENQTLRFVKTGLGPSNTIAAEADEVKQSPAIQALIAQSDYASLQRVGAKYWDPIAVFGKTLVDGNASSSNMQALMDEMVKEITAKVTE